MTHDYHQQNPIGIWSEQASPSTARAQVTSRWTPIGERSTVTEQKRPIELLHALVEKQAELQPHKPALCDGRVCWSYSELEGRANQLAHLLRSRGVRAGSLVGVNLSRSAQAIVAILGILKAGGAYVPLDPEYPRDWSLTILGDAGIELLVTVRVLALRLPSDAVQTICLDEMGECLLESSTERLDSGVKPMDPAYVIYTSGSTGGAKGVIVEHRNVVYSTQCRLGYYSKPVDRFALIPSLAFDASVAAIFWTLSQGGTLCLPPADFDRDPARLSQWVAVEEISHWLSVPALYQLLLEQPSELLRSLRVVVLGGDSCPATLVRTHHAALPHAELYNEYGPTETTVWSSVHACEPSRSDVLVPIGRPLPGTRFLVLDESGHPVEAGQPGELFIGGPGVARGYHKRSKLTSEQFARIHILGRPGQVLYRTGDRVKQLGDGSYQFLGRLDHQTKVRGHRVELGQVEAAFGMMDEVAQAVVVTQRKMNHDQLVAFVVPRYRTRISVSELRQKLRTSLPSYMIPSHIVLRDRLPLTARGKIDRQALQATDLQLTVETRRITLPSDETERRLLACWESVFGQKPISVCDDFFELGGDSLLAAALFARIEAAFCQTLPPDTLLEHPTARLLAKLLRTPSNSHALGSAVRVYAGLSQPPLFCLPGIGGHVLAFHELARQLRTRRAVYGLRPAGLEGESEPHGSIDSMARHAIDQMRRIQPDGPYALVGYSLGGVVAFEMARQLSNNGQKIAILALLDSRLWSPGTPLSLPQRLQLHGHNLYHSTMRGRWDYICERVRILAARLRRLSFYPSDDDVILGLRLSAASKRVARQHWRAWRDYRPGNYDGDLSLFVARRHAGMPELDGRDPTFGWSHKTSGSVDVTRMNATHSEMLSTGNSTILASAIEAQLARVFDRQSHPTTY